MLLPVLIISLFFRLVHPTEDQENLIEIVKWLDQNGFEPFKVMSILHEGDDLSKYKVEMNELRDNYHLLRRCLERKEEKFSAGEAVKLVQLADYYMATDSRMTRVIEAFLNAVRVSTEPLPNLKINPQFHKALQLYLGEIMYFGIQLNYFEVKLDSCEASLDNKQFALKLLMNLAPSHSEIRIKNLIIDEDNFAQVQKLLLDNLLAVSFENCSFLQSNSKYLDFKNLRHLTKFQFSGSYCPNFIQMLKTVPSESLVELDISDNPFKKEEIIELISIFKNMRRLATLNVSFNFLFKWRRAKFTGNIFKLTHLTSLNLSGNLDISSFSKVLSNMKKRSKLRYLDISNNDDDDRFRSEWKTIFLNLSKFSSLERLNLSGITVHDDRFFLSKFYNLKRIKEFTFDAEDNFSLVASIPMKIKSNNLQLKLNSEKDWFYPESIFDTLCYKKINLKHETLSSILFYWDLLYYSRTDNSDFLYFKTVSDVIHLSIELSKFSPEFFNESGVALDRIELVSSILSDFFSKLNQLECLRLDLYGLVSFEYLKLLLEQNLIKTLVMHISANFVQFYQLFEVIDNCFFQSVSISANFPLEFSIESWSSAKMWQQMETFEWQVPSIGHAIFILENANFLKLRSVSITVLCENQEISSSIILPTVMELEITVLQRQIGAIRYESYLPALIRMFPNISSLTIKYSAEPVSPFDISSLKNLHFLQIECSELERSESFLENIRLLPSLTHIAINERRCLCEPPTQTLFGRHLKFKSLIFSKIQSANNQMKREFVLQPFREDSLLVRKFNSLRRVLMP